MTTLAQDKDIAAILREFRGNPQEASALAEFLGFEPLPNPQDQLAGVSGGAKLGRAGGRLLTILNSMIKLGRPWNPDQAQLTS